MVVEVVDAAVSGATLAAQGPASLRSSSNASANQLKKPEDDPFITVQIPEAEIFDHPPAYTEEDGAISTGEKKGSWFKRHLSDSKSKASEDTIGVRMRKSEFRQYFIKDPKSGKYREDTTEPPEGRMQWLQNRIQEFQNGELDEEAYVRGLAKDYDDLPQRSKIGKATHAIGKGADFMGQPYTPWAGQPIR